MHETTTTQFNCVDCNALYHLIKVETQVETHFPGEGTVTAASL
jgi:hypothetical protein